MIITTRKESGEIIDQFEVLFPVSEIVDVDHEMWFVEEGTGRVVSAVDGREGQDFRTIPADEQVLTRLDPRQS